MVLHACHCPWYAGRLVLSKVKFFSGRGGEGGGENVQREESQGVCELRFSVQCLSLVSTDHLKFVF